MYSLESWTLCDGKTSLKTFIVESWNWDIEIGIMHAISVPAGIKYFLFGSFNNQTIGKPPVKNEDDIKEVITVAPSICLFGTGIVKMLVFSSVLKTRFVSKNCTAFIKKENNKKTTRKQQEEIIIIIYI